jgi:2-methylcitrate dehydratase PrpD
MHPGWGALAGITAAYLVRSGFAAPARPYEGRFGFFETHMQSHLHEVDFASISDGLGSCWTLLDTSIKPFPVCHFIHGCAEAALQLQAAIGPAAKIAHVTCELPLDTLPIVAQPAAAKARPRTDYEAKFSAPFVVAACLLRGRFGLAELEHASLSDPRILELTPRIRCVPEQDSQFPTYFSGAVSVQLASGETLTRRVPVNLGSGERALRREEIIAKFRTTTEIVLPAQRIAEVLETVLSASPATPVRTITQTLRG